MSDSDPFNAKRELDIGGAYFALQALDDSGISTAHLPYSMRVLLEGALRNCDGFLIREEDVKSIAGWQANSERGEIPFVLLGLFFKISQVFLQLLILQPYVMQWYKWAGIQKKSIHKFQSIWSLTIPFKSTFQDLIPMH
jgi:aconitase A